MISGGFFVVNLFFLAVLISVQSHLAHPRQGLILDPHPSLVFLLSK